MAKEIELYLEKDGFYAGTKTKNGKMAAGSHKITEDEILTMSGTLIRAFHAKTGKDTMMVMGDDGKAFVAKLVTVRADNEGMN